MRILHYSLGFPPYRTGGLTKFCMDLSREQIRQGHKVSILWPGEIGIFGHNTRIRKHKAVDGIGNYEVINPTPVPFDEGIKDFSAFVALGDSEVYEKLLLETNPDIVHVHTLMGIHKSFLEVTKNKNIRLIFSAHDFFPICAKVTMFRNGQICKCVETCEECGFCNNTALSLKKIQILQSPLYRNLKDSAYVKKLRKQHRDEYLDERKEDNNTSVGKPADYKHLREHYSAMLRMMDKIHYNSSVTKQAYERVLNLPKNVIVHISHSDIGDHRRIRCYNENLKIRYLGPKAKGKGFNILFEAVKRLVKDGRKVTLDVHFSLEGDYKFVISHNRFSTAELKEIFDSTDVLVCPSIWYETFGYTVLEALSYGVPVIVSGTVGAKDIIVSGAGIVVEDINAEKLYDALKNVNSRMLEGMNKVIIERQNIMTINKMAQEIEEKVYTI